MASVLEKNEYYLELFHKFVLKMSISIFDFGHTKEIDNF